MEKLPLLLVLVLQLLPLLLMGTKNPAGGSTAAAAAVVVVAAMKCVSSSSTGMNPRGEAGRAGAGLRAWSPSLSMLRKMREGECRGTPSCEAGVLP